MADCGTPSQDLLTKMARLDLQDELLHDIAEEIERQADDMDCNLDDGAFRPEEDTCQGCHYLRMCWLWRRIKDR